MLTKHLRLIYFTENCAYLSKFWKCSFVISLASEYILLLERFSARFIRQWWKLGQTPKKKILYMQISFFSKETWLNINYKRYERKKPSWIINLFKHLYCAYTFWILCLITVHYLFSIWKSETIKFLTHLSKLIKSYEQKWTLLLGLYKFIIVWF